jgi:uncharacterized DUF497 family protein
VSFEEARTVFLDENALLQPDEEHSGDEDRFVLLGLSAQLRTLVVCHLLPTARRGHPYHLRAQGKFLRARAVRRSENEMRKNYDFSTAVRNPYAKRLKRQLTIRLDEETIDYFQGLSHEMSLPYQTLMNMYLRDCAETRKRPHWSAASTTKRANKPTKRTGTARRLSA